MNRTKSAGFYFFGGLFAISVFGEPLSLKRATDLAAKNSPEVEIAATAVEATSADVGMAYSEFWPKVFAIGSYRLSKTETYSAGGGATGETNYTFNNQSNYNLALSWNIFNSFSSLNNLNSALTQRNASLFSKSKAIQVSRMTAIQAYFSAVAYSEQSNYLKELTLYLSEVNRKVSEAFKAQAISKKEQVAVNYLFKDIKLKSFEAEAQLKKNLRYLGDLIGRKDLKDKDLIDDIRSERRPSPKAETLFGQMRAKDPELKAREAQLDAMEFRRIATIAREFPKVDIEGRYGDSGGYIGVGVSIPMFSGFSSFSQRKSLAAQKARLAVEKTRYESSLRELVNKLVDEMSMASTNIGFLTEAIKDANAIWKIANRSYRMSASEATEWEGALKRLVAAEMDMIKNLLIYRVAEASIRELETRVE